MPFLTCRSLSDGIYHDVLRGNVLEIDAVDLPGHLLIVRHPGRCHQIGYFKRGIRSKGSGIVGRSRKRGNTIFVNSGLVPDGIPQTTVVDLFDTLHDLEQSSSTGNAVGLQGRGHSQADGFLRAAGIGHDQIGGQRIEMPCDAFCRGIIRLEAYCQIRALRHAVSLPFHGGFRNVICLLFQVP